MKPTIVEHGSSSSGIQKRRLHNVLPSILTRQIRHGVEDHIRASFAPSAKSFDRIIEDFLETPGALLKGPWITLELPFRQASSTVEFFPKLPLGFVPYRHQEKAFDRLAAKTPRSTLIATGTGSGKTECFLLPMLNACIEAAGRPGIKAIVIYPMNALASDQARRIAALIAKTPALAGIRVGMYADQRPENPSDEMTRSNVIDSREALVRDPPDILLTNYKMLDYMLVRPDERSMWERNRPETLRYLVVDELHTFDGAQGTDLASLIRRLKARLKMASGFLCCVGTSATLGGPSSAGDLVAYARSVFDEPFDEDAIVTEDRKTVAEYLDGVEVTTTDLPEARGLRRILDQATSSGRSALLGEAFKMWFHRAPDADVDDAAWRVRLGELIRGHSYFHKLLEICQGQVIAMEELVAELRRDLGFRERPETETAVAVDMLLALVAHARRSEGAMMRPFLNVRIQLWLREMRRMVATVTTKPTLQHYDDLVKGDQDKSLPVVHCRSCGSAGWVTSESANSRRPLVAEPREIYKSYFGFSDSLRFIFRDTVPHDGKGVSGQNRQGILCSECLTFNHVAGKDGDKCPSCGREDSVIAVTLLMPGRMVSGTFRVDHDCSFCGSPSGMGILGAQSVTLVSGMVGTLFNSEFNDDPKLLTFSDSVQDAAHRAAVFQARNAATVFRAGLARFVCEKVDPDLEQVIHDAPTAMMVGQDQAEDFVATYIPADMNWRRDYADLLAKDNLPEDSRLPEYLEERLGWEAFAELTFRGRLGATIEKSGVAVAHAEASRVIEAAGDIHHRLADEIGQQWRHVDLGEVRWFLLGMLDHMRAQGAVANEVTRTYVRTEADWYKTTRRVGGGHNSLPNYAPASPKPVFPANRTLAGFEPYAIEGGRSWYPAWLHSCFDRSVGLIGTSGPDLFRLVFDRLNARGLVERMPIGAGDSGASSAWGLLPRYLRIFSETSLVRCDACGNAHRVPEKHAGLWRNMPCTRVGCDGRLADANDDDRTRFRSRLMTEGRIKRVVAAEHTSLMSREERQLVEHRFMQDAGRTWYPNLLAATPTLEMGINIGDLSTLVLCSVPPEQSNYVQRIGRTGRRDGNSLNVTVAMARPHDMWFWADPEEMISGQVRTPGVHLGAVAILKRQFAAYSLDRWVAEEGAGVSSYGKVGDALRAIRTNNRRMFPLFWFDFIERNAQRLFEDFAVLFPELVEPLALEQLSAFAIGSATDGLAHMVASEFRSAEIELDSIEARINATKAMAAKVKKQNPPDLDQKDRLRDLDGEKKALRSIRDEIRKSDGLGFLTDRGILPNYAFPEEGATLKSILYRTDSENPQAEKPTTKSYERPAASALTEFAPGASFYTQGRKLTIDQVDLTVSPMEHWRVCPDCIHIERFEAEATESSCPSCGSAMWADRGSRRTMLRLKQVFATGTDRSTRIPEEGDDRDRKPFDRDYLPAVERDQTGEAFAIDEDVVPFAYEFLRRCTFREVNFGESNEAPTGQKIAGNRRYGHGFQICRSCGKVQDRAALRRLPPEKRARGLHLLRCSEADSAGDDTFVAVIYIYREFSSEAIRLLLPFASSRDSDEVDSFRAALDLGLRLHFRGKVTHLRSSLVETKEGPLTRRYLYLYDSIPGGTGYLKQLSSRTEDMRNVLQGSLDHMQACVCNSDPNKDGCPRCIRSHAATFGRGEISRNSAVRQLAQILAGWMDIHPVGSVMDIKLNKALESELEQMFIERLRQTVRDCGGVFNKIVVSGKPGYAIKLGKGEWKLEPQCWIQDRFPGAPPTRADLVLWPAVPGPGAPKPMAIYLDGWQFHGQSVPEDLTLRQNLIRTGHLLVWSASWDDVANGPETGKIKHFWEPLAVIPEKVQKLKNGDALTIDAQGYLELSPFEQFIDYLKAPGIKVFEARASTLAAAWFVAGMANGQDHKEAAHVIDGLAGPEGERTLLDVDQDSFWGRLEVPGGATLISAAKKTWRPPEWPSAEDLTVVMGFEHRLAKSSEAKKAWNGALRLLNIMQFLPYFYVGCAESVTPPAKLRLGTPAEDDPWDDIEQIVLPDLSRLVRDLRDRHVAVPEVIHEAVGTDGQVLGTLELAWPDRRVGVLLDASLSPAFPGWTVHLFVDKPSLLDALLEALR